MTADDRQRGIIEDYALVDDPRERFQLLVETAAAGCPPFPEEARHEGNLVPGCVSRVWIATSARPDGSIAVWIDSESPALRALGALFARIYSGSPPPEILATEPVFVERLGIDRQLTPTRLRGLRRLREEIVARALAPCDPGP
jgi:cysteine desulfuration protein SufE